MRTNKEIYQQVTDSLLTLMEQGVPPWRQPWVSGLPCNADSLHEYQGVNVLLLWAATWSKGYQSRGWVTFDGAKRNGCPVRKGEKSTTVVLFKTRVVKGTGEEADKVIPMARAFWLFNLAQLTEGPELEKLKAKVDGKPVTPIDEVEAVVAATGAKIVHAPGEGAAYWPLLDEVHMPLRNSFVSTDKYYGVLMHELVHWTSKRCKRALGKPGTEEYAAEELVAELGSAMLMARLGFEFSDRHPEDSAAYLKHWAAHCRKDPGVLVHAASQARAAAEFLFPSVKVHLEEVAA